MFSRQLIEAQEDERRRIARDLHDQIGQTLTAVKMNLYTVQRFCSAPEAAHCLKDNIDAVDEALRLVRDLSVDLRPPLLDDLGLATALCWYVDRYEKRAGVTTEVLIEMPNRNERFSRDLETACFRIAQEALTNVVRHARATHVVAVNSQREFASDDCEETTAPVSIRVLRRREAYRHVGAAGDGACSRAGGVLEIHSKLSRGTELRFSVPVDNTDPA